MAELMLINPRKRRRKSKVRARKRSRSRIRARRRKSYPLAMMNNPRKRRRRSRGMRRSFKRATGGFKPMAFVNETLMPSAIGAAGALGLDMLLGFIPLPETLKVGPMRPLVRIAGAVGIGVIAGMVTNKRMGEQVGAGALTVVLYDTLKGFVQRTMPNVKLGEYNDVDITEYPTLEYLNPGAVVSDTDSMGEYISPEMGEYIYNQ